MLQNIAATAWQAAVVHFFHFIPGAVIGHNRTNLNFVKGWGYHARDAGATGNAGLGRPTR
jgi:hypothetical protein